MRSNINAMLKEVIAEIKAIGIPCSDYISPIVDINKRAKSRMGQCQKLIGKGFKIEITEVCLQKSEKGIRETLVHEVLHTCPQCLNHGNLWKLYANKMNKHYGYNIKRTGELPEHMKAEPKPAKEKKYAICCLKCETEIAYQKLSKAVMNPEQYRCKCGGKLKRTK